MKQILTLTALITAFLVTGCESSRQSAADLIAPLPKLTKSIQAEIRYDHSKDVAKMTDEQVVAEATKTDPGLAAVFAPYKLKLLRNERDVIVLVCSPDDKRALLEDASWTPQVDKLWFQIAPQHLASFSLSLSDAPQYLQPTSLAK